MIALGELQRFCLLAMPDMPPEAWWVALAVLVILGVAAAIDLVKGIVPDPLIFLGMAGLVAAEGVYVTWPFSAHQMTFGLIFAAAIWGINELWYRVFKHDALGLGDAKWSLLAVTCFGLVPVLCAWGIGAVFGTFWIGLLKIIRKPTAHVHFAPFLFMGLIFALWLTRLNGLQILRAN